MEEQVLINEKLKEELRPLCGEVEAITVYKKENGKVFFKVGRNKFHLPQKEYNESIKRN